MSARVRTFDATICRTGDLPQHDLASERPEDNHSEFHWQALGRSCLNHHEHKKELTIHIDQTGAMADQAIRRLQQVVETNTQANLLNDLVGVLLVDIIFNCHGTELGEVFGRDLDQIGKSRLGRGPSVRIFQAEERGTKPTRMNMV